MEDQGKLRGCTPRVQSLRRESLTKEPTVDLERAALFTRAYQIYEGSVSIPVLRGLALKYYFEHKTLWFGDLELIVGEKGKAPLSAPTFPDLCCHTLEDMDIMNQRDLIGFKVDPSSFKYQEEDIIPYWEKRSLRNRIVSSMSDEWRSCYSAGIFTEFMEQRGPGHTVAGHQIYQKGFKQYREEILDEINQIDIVNDSKAYQKIETLRGMAIACEAIMVLGQRYALMANEKASQCDDTAEGQQRKSELLAIAQNCETVPTHAPKTFWQALQMYWFVHLAVTSEVNPWDAYSPGRLDQHLIPFYNSDLEANRLTEPQALELLECLWVKFNNQPAPPKVGITLKESGTYTDFVNINTGGITPSGHNGVNAVSYLILECMDEMRLLQPSSNVQISKKTPHHFLIEALKIASQGWGQPAFYNTDAIVQELLEGGKTLCDARLGGASGCVETGAFGTESYILTGYFNLPKILEITLNNGFDPVSKQQLGLALGMATSFESFDALFEAYAAQVAHFVDIKVKGSNIIEAIYAQHMPVPFLSVITADCIKNGTDYNAGGARYNTNYIQGVGIATITDSLAAIKQGVFVQKAFTMQQMMQALSSNFECDLGVHIHGWIDNFAPKYGNDDDRADDLMKSVFNLFYNTVTGRPTPRGGHYRINMLPTTCHIYFGQVIMATPNGRKAHKPLSEGISPEKGADRLGPTAVLKSAAKMDHLKTGGTLLNQKFNPSDLKHDQGLEKLAQLVRTYFSMDGHHIQFNVIDKKVLLAAQENPEAYKDLIVRVAGYSDHFRNLSRALQDEIIERTEQSL